MPSRIALARSRLRDARFPWAVVEAFQNVARVVAFIGDEIAGFPRRRRKAHSRQILFRFLQRGIERCRVALVGLVDRRRHDHARVEIDRMFGRVGEMRRAVLHLGDLRLRIGLARPVFVGELLTFALTVEPDQVVDRRRPDTAFLGHPSQHLAIAFAIVTAHDRPQRRSVDIKWTQDQGHWIEGRSINEAQDNLTLSRVLLDIWKNVPKKKPLRVGVSLSDIVPANEHQQDLFDKPQNASLTKAIDELNEKFGKGMVGFGLAASSSRKLTSKIAFQRVPDLSEF